MQKFKLTCAEYKALLSIDSKETLPCKVLASNMGLSESRGNRIINRLIKRGYYNFSYDKNDKRIVYVSLNPKGLRLKMKINKMLSDCDKEINNRLSKSEINSFINIINKVNKVLTKNN